MSIEILRNIVQNLANNMQSRSFGKLTLLIGIVFFLSSCENDMVEINRVIEKQEIGVERAEDVEILYSDSAIVRVKITSPFMLFYLDKNDPRREFPEGLTVDFFNENFKIQSTMTAKYAIRYEKKFEVVAKDSVTINSVKGEKLETEELVWNEKTGKISSDKLVTISTGEERIWGYQFESNQDFTEWTLDSVAGQVASKNIVGDMEDLE